MSAVQELKRRWHAEGGYRQVLAMAIPLIFSTGSWSLQGFINRMFLAWHSPEALAAAMPAGMVNYAIMSVFISTAGYVSTFVAQYHGAGQDARVGRVVWQALPIALFAGLFNLALIPAAPAFFSWVGHAPAVQAEEVRLFQILCLGAFPVVMFNAFSGMLSGLGRTTAVMVVTLAATGANILLDWLLIFGHAGFPALGIVGAGWAAVTAGVIQCVAFSAIVLGRRFRATYRMDSWRPQAKALGALLRYGVPSGVQFFVDMGGFTAFILLVGRLGRNELAATNLAFNVNTIAFMPMIGIGITVSVLVGQALGRNDPRLARASVGSAFQLTALYMVTVAVLFFLVPRLFIFPFAAASDPREFAAISDLAAVLLRFVAVYTLFDAGNIIFSSAIKGAGDTRFVMWMILCLSLGIMVLPNFAAIRWFSAGIYVCWTLASAYVIVLAVAFFLRYRQGKWESMRVIETPALK
ncbi:MAG TPA: MATE family efflux transporter [Spirochaetia bacterium]|nr:MATE family efflux transporter [Spirochaetia bacterium]